MHMPLWLHEPSFQQPGVWGGTHLLQVTTGRSRCNAAHATAELPAFVYRFGGVWQ